MSSYNQSQISRLEGELASLEKDAASEAKKEADLIAKINRANYSAGRTNSIFYSAVEVARS